MTSVASIRRWLDALATASTDSFKEANALDLNIWEDQSWFPSIQALFLIAPLPKVMVEANPVVQIATSMGASRITGAKREAPRVHIVRKNPYLLLRG